VKLDFKIRDKFFISNGLELSGKFTERSRKNYPRLNQNRIKTLSSKVSYTYYKIFRLSLMDYGQNVPIPLAAPRFPGKVSEEKFISAEEINCDLCCVTNAEES
jgi:hypothetical protein